MNLKDKIKNYFNKPRFAPFIIGGVLLLGGAAVGVALSANESSMPKERVSDNQSNSTNSNITMTDKKNESSNKEIDSSSKAEQIKNSGEVIQMDTENQLQNPLASDSKNMTKEEWDLLKKIIDDMVREFNFVKANEMLNNRVVGLPLDKLPFGTEIQETHMDINGLAFIENTYSNNITDEEVGAVINPLSSQNTAERALIAALWISTNAKVEVILNQESLIPIAEEAPVIEKEYPLEDVHTLRVINNTYPSVEAVVLDFTLEGFPLHGILLKHNDGTYRVWSIYQEKDGKAPYQNGYFWREYLKHISPAGAKKNQGSGHGYSHSDDYIVDTPDPRVNKEGGE